MDSAQFVWLTISDGEMVLTEVPDMVSTDEMADRFGFGHLLPVQAFRETPGARD